MAASPLFSAEATVSSIPSLADQPEQWAEFMTEDANVEKYFESLDKEE
jgi:hypothetical protein